jgi:hypothetical protein
MIKETLRLEHLLSLIQAVDTLQESTIERVRSRYAQSATGFEEALVFLANIGAVSLNDDAIVLSSDLANWQRPLPRLTAKHQVSELINRKMLRRSNAYWNLTRRFLVLFTMTGGDLNLTLTFDQVRRYAGIRNLLLETSLLRRDGNILTIEDQYVERVQRLIKSRGGLRTLKRKLMLQEQLGHLAEQVILDYERIRLSNFPDLAQDVTVISEERPDAGYDVESFEFPKSGLSHRVQRSIEVKAVPRGSYRFFWSRNEIRVAKDLESEYHLYLLPFENLETPLLSELRIIVNPAREILAEVSEWDCKTEVISCRLPSISTETRWYPE